ncbi:MAG: Agmatinase (EC [uncultured Caballeronia sp.]|nr:MAG: Agmatinase (EC [uncultured Caballeronia sp.]
MRRARRFARQPESSDAMNTSSLFASAEHFDSHFLEQRAERPQPLSGNQMPR